MPHIAQYVLLEAPSRRGMLRLNGSKRAVDGSGSSAFGDTGKKPGDA